MIDGLHEHQKRLADKLKSREGQLLYWELGSGKTLGAINASRELGLPATVVVPASLQNNFKKELHSFNVPEKDFRITTFDKIKNDGVSHDNEMLIVDEAHRLRNYSTKRSKTISSLAPNYSKRIFLTGTPIQDKPSDFVPIINAIKGYPVLPSNPKQFNKRYLGVTYTDVSAYDRIINGVEPKQQYYVKNKHELRSAIKGLVDYHSPYNSADFPSKKEYLVRLPMTEKQMELYNYFEEQVPKSLQRKIDRYEPASSQELGKLNSFLSATRQISNTGAKYGLEEISPKIRAVLDSVSKTKGPSVIYSNYLDSGIMPLSKELQKRSIPHAIFTGSQTSSEKANIIKDYNKGKLKALLISSSGGEGLDLKNTRAVHIMEPHWNEPKIDQIIGRAIRYKSHSSLPEAERNVAVYHYLQKFPKKENILTDLNLASSENHEVTADQYLYAMSKRKQDINNLFNTLLKEEGSRNGKAKFS